VKALKLSLAAQDAASLQRGAKYPAPPLCSEASEDSFLATARAHAQQLGGLQRLRNERMVADATFASAHRLGGALPGNENDAVANLLPPPSMLVSNALEASHYAHCRAPPPPASLCVAVSKGDGATVRRHP
jgi:hypothetical protein